MFEKVGLIAKHGGLRVGETLGRLIGLLRARGREVVLDDRSRDACPEGSLPVVAREEIGRQCDLVVVVAGDGTFLGAARTLVDQDVPLLGVNLGRLGFLADVMPDEMSERLNEILDGEFVEEQRFLLDVAVERNTMRVFSGTALNEAATHKSSMARLVEFETYIDHHFVNRQRSDGLIVATPTGSTAYALSGGGPIVHPALDAIVLVPICPHTLSSRPVVVGGGSVVEVVLGDEAESSVQLSCDGESTLQLGAGDRISIAKHRPALRLIHPVGHEYYATLRTKLHWGKGP
ncbi:MAG: NAD(+) kinase [Thiotrichales bacterium]|nr:NAD(+) kinase [Thiotrichales bacterium]MCY4286383.1 NAD(+) kinase [Thiotrichales bacterium]MCY4350732.1 NAD(+) kinase [Thiotrichales bacterium]